MLRLLMCCICLTALAQQSAAGAWLREEKGAFLSLAITGREGFGGDEAEVSAYGEYGLRPRFTLGMDINTRRDLGGHALLFARFPISDDMLGGRVAVELGVGAHAVQGDWAEMVKMALSWGRGLDGPGGGWIAIDAAAEYRAGLQEPFLKLDATVGFPSRYRVRPMLQIETTTLPGNATYWAVTPSLIYQRSPGRRWIMGVESKHGPDRSSLGLKLGIWRDF